MNKASTIACDTVGAFLYRNLKTDNDDIEKAFFNVNPGVAQYGVVLPSGLELNLPDLPEPEVKKVVAVWA